jgi:hypothetical protein
MSSIRSFLFAMLLVSTQSMAGFFNITVNNVGGLSSSQADIFDDAVNFWEFVLPGVQSALNLNLVISASGENIDGVGNVLGSAGPSSIAQALDVGIIYTTRGTMRFDTADLDALERANLLFDVVVHEMALQVQNCIDTYTGHLLALTQILLLSQHRCQIITKINAFTSARHSITYNQKFIS